MATGYNLRSRRGTVTAANIQIPGAFQSTPRPEADACRNREASDSDTESIGSAVSAVDSGPPQGTDVAVGVPSVSALTEEPRSGQSRSRSDEADISSLTDLSSMLNSLKLEEESIVLVSPEPERARGGGTTDSRARRGRRSLSFDAAQLRRPEWSTPTLGTGDTQPEAQQPAIITAAIIEPAGPTRTKTAYVEDAPDDSEDESRGEGPSRWKGKTVDARNWGAVGIPEEELDPEAQRRALEEFSQGKKPSEEAPPSSSEDDNPEDLSEDALRQAVKLWKKQQKKLASSRTSKDTRDQSGDQGSGAHHSDVPKRRDCGRSHTRLRGSKKARPSSGSASSSSSSVTDSDYEPEPPHKRNRRFPRRRSPSSDSSPPRLRQCERARGLDTLRDAGSLVDHAMAQPGELPLGRPTQRSHQQGAPIRPANQIEPTSYLGRALQGVGAREAQVARPRLDERTALLPRAVLARQPHRALGTVAVALGHDVATDALIVVTDVELAVLPVAARTLTLSRASLTPTMVART
ncbi:hypothetical protein CERSUDRAFT_69837 [Gelatoporia subvermispora B]|uniref:Uncharacterized protein n=1 Tax=Ceriporiopsis subvermispora (strain B) TaxID=914234 RepID=M2PWM9_CERS8|nr:hypothetical protein CERSUDRAFT_69837 [Gelatoporia subvermispora B]